MAFFLLSLHNQLEAEMLQKMVMEMARRQVYCTYWPEDRLLYLQMEMARRLVYCTYKWPEDRSIVPTMARRQVYCT